MAKDIPQALLYKEDGIMYCIIKQYIPITERILTRLKYHIIKYSEEQRYPLIVDMRHLLHIDAHELGFSEAKKWIEKNLKHYCKAIMVIGI